MERGSVSVTVRKQRGTLCGLCGRRTRFIGSHVLSDHLSYIRTQAEVQAAMSAERAARAAR